jgi:hypothetical protein
MYFSTAAELQVHLPSNWIWWDCIPSRDNHSAPDTLSE